MLTLRLGGVDAQTIGPYGHVGDMEVNWVRATTGSGLNYVKWSMALPKNYSHSALQKGTKVELFRADLKLGSAVMSEPDRNGDGWSFVAEGLFRRAKKFYPLAGNSALETLGPSIEAANLRGLGWNGLGDLPSTIVAEKGGSSSIADILTAYCESRALRWGLTADDVPFIDADPYLYDQLSVPGWAVTPGKPLMPASDDLFATRVHVKYVGGGDVRDRATYDTATSVVTGDPTLPGGHEVTVFASPVSVIGGVAQAMADDIFRQNSLRYAFTQGLEIFPGELTTPGGTPIDNWAAYTLLGKLGNHQGAINRLNNAAVGETVQWVMGSVTYRPGDNSLKIASVDLDPRNFAGVMSRLAARLPSNDPIARTMLY